MDKAMRIRFERTAQLIKPGKVLDIGCNKCLLKGFLPKGCDYHGVDLEPKKKGIKKADVSYQKLPYKTGTFDTVVMTEVLEHLENPSFALREVRRVLKRGGSIVGSVPNIQNLARIGLVMAKDATKKKYWGHLAAYGSLELNNLLRHAGLKPRLIEPVVNRWRWLYLPQIRLFSFQACYLLFKATK